MIKLIKARVQKYKSINDSGTIDLSPCATVLVGKNESGKTAFLEALHKALPHGSAKYDYIIDYPRKDLMKYRPEHKAGNFEKVVELTFLIEDSLVKKINDEVFFGEEVIPLNTTFVRSTTINNKSTISFNIDENKALSALEKNLDDIEHKANVFKNSKSLENVIDNINNLNLPSDNDLCIFAAEWNNRRIAPKNWKLIEGHIWEKYITPYTPKFLYFDDYKLLKGKINLSSLRQSIDSNQLCDSDETAQGLLELAGTTLDELISDDGYETAKAKLESISLQITEKVFEFWKQNQDLDVEFDLKSDANDTAPFNNGVNLYIRIKNRRHGVTVSFDQRSKGFIWFFSFLVWFDAVQSRAATENNLILLLDEPGLNLHALAQEDFLAYIQELSKKHQIIYTTHSPFMIDNTCLKDVRVVEDKINEGTKVTAELAGSSDEGLFPLQAALGYSIAQNLFIAKKNILIEGPSDLILLQHIATLLETENESAFCEAVLVPTGGLSNIVTFIALLGSNKLKLVVLHDCSSKPEQKIEDLIRQKLIERKRVLNYSMFIESKPTEADIEDMLPQNLYVEAFNNTYDEFLNGKLLKAEDLNQHPRIVERINKWLQDNEVNILPNGGFNHYKVAQEAVKLINTDSLSGNYSEQFKKMFQKIKELLK